MKNEDSIIVCLIVHLAKLYYLLRVSEKSLKYDVQLFDVFGKLVLQQNDIMGNTTLSTTEFNQGIYFLQITNENHQIIHSQKIIK